MSHFPFFNFLKKEAFWIGFISIFLVVMGYWHLSWERHLINPSDQLLPLPSQLWDALQWALTPQQLNNERPLVIDTLSSLSRLLTGLSCAVLIALICALCIHTFKRFHALVFPLIMIFAKVPPIALLPIILLWLGLDESAKLVLLIIGITPNMILMLYHQLQSDHQKLKDKLFSLRLPYWQRLYFIHLPMLWPSFLHLIQVNLGPAWLFLLVAETFGAESGLGYRIFIVRRYLSMDIIIVYVIWITLLSLFLYFILEKLRKRYTWADSL